MLIAYGDKMQMMKKLRTWIVKVYFDLGRSRESTYMNIV
jgi:hypothetical protein